MNGGMRIDPKKLPLRYQEQVGAALVAQLAQAAPVAGREAKPSGQRVHVRRLRFKNTRAAMRYLQLREEDRNGTISDLVLHMNEKKFVICRFTYCVKEEY